MIERAGDSKRDANSAGAINTEPTYHFLPLFLIFQAGRWLTPAIHPSGTNIFGEADQSLKTHSVMVLKGQALFCFLSDEVAAVIT